MRIAVKIALVALGVILCGVLVVGTNTVMPGHAPVYLDDESRTYLAAPCEAEWQRRNGATANRLRFGTASEARRRNYGPDDHCRSTGLHAPEGRSAAGLLFEMLGILPPLKYWWDEM